jgi:hypothetical protein
MSTLVAQTLSNGTVSTSTANCIQGSAKAWCNYNGVSQTIIGSFNISSVTYNGAGNYNFNFTTAMPNANYAIVAGAGRGSGTGLFPELGTPSTSSFNVTYINSALSANTNPQYASVAVFS